MSGGEFRSSEVLEYSFRVPSFTAAAGVLIAMRSVSLELREDTIVNLYTAPINEWQMVLGKWLAFAFVLLFIALGGFMPLLIVVNGTINPGHLMSGYLGLVLAGAAAAALAPSAGPLEAPGARWGPRGRHLWLAGGDVVGGQQGGPALSALLAYAVYQKHFEDFGRGIIQSRSLSTTPALHSLPCSASCRPRCAEVALGNTLSSASTWPVSSSSFPGKGLWPRQCLSPGGRGRLVLVLAAFGTRLWRSVSGESKRVLARSSPPTALAPLAALLRRIHSRRSRAQRQSDLVLQAQVWCWLAGP